MLVLIFPSLQGEDDLEYTNRVANISKVKGDKALMLFVFVQDHKIRIQVGYGLEAVITDAFSSDVIRNTITPAFKQGQYAAGISAGLDQLAKKIDPNFTAPGGVQPVQRPIAPRSSTPAPSGSDIVILVVLFLVFIFVILPLLRRGGGCGGCGGCLLPMFWGGGGGGTFGGGGFSGGGGGGGWSTGGSWGGGGSSFGGGGAGGSW